MIERNEGSDYQRAMDRHDPGRDQNVGVAHPAHMRGLLYWEISGIVGGDGADGSDAQSCVAR
jgi:hypothetical protein